MSAVSIIVSTATLGVGLAYLGATFVLGILAAWTGFVLGRQMPGAQKTEATQ
jgi:hypothetical protein